MRVNTAQFARMIDKKETAYQVPKSALWFFANYAAELMQKDFLSGAALIGEALRRTFKDEAIRATEARLKSSGYYGPIKRMAEALVTKDYVSAVRVATKWKISITEVAILEEIVDYLEAL